MNPTVVALIADYFEVPEKEADGLLIHLRINGWTVVAIPDEQATAGESEDATTSKWVWDGKLGGFERPRNG